MSTDEGNRDLFNNSGQHLLKAYVPDSVPFILCITSLHTHKSARDRHRHYLYLQMRKPRLGKMKCLAQCHRASKW